MPTVRGKKFPYTAKGKSAAAKARKAPTSTGNVPAKMPYRGEPISGTSGASKPAYPTPRGLPATPGKSGTAGKRTASKGFARGMAKRTAAKGQAKRG